MAQANIQIADQFRGLNLTNDSKNLLPGQATDLSNLYIERGTLKSRPFRKVTADLAIKSGGANVVSLFQVYLLSRIAHLAIVEGGKLFIRQDLANSWTELGSILSGGNYKVLQYKDPSLGVPMDAVVLFRPGVMYLISHDGADYTLTSVDTIPSFPQANLAFAADIGVVDWGFQGHAQYALKITNTATNQSTVLQIRNKHFDPNFNYEQARIAMNVEWDITITNTPYTQANYEDIEFKLYRRDIERASGEIVTQEEFYYLVDTIAGFSTSTTVYTDNTPRDSKDFTDYLDPNQISIDPDVCMCAAWYQQRVVWGRSDGGIMISALNDPFTTNVLLSNIPVTQRTLSIFHMVEMLGTLFIFTSEGIFHLTGTIGDTEETGNFTLYCAVPMGAPHEAGFIESKNLIVRNNYIYVAGEAGLYRYDGRNLQLLSRNIQYYWNGIDYPSMVLDELRKYIIISSANRTYSLVYHYENEFTYPELQPGEWTKFGLQIADSCKSESKAEPAYKFPMIGIGAQVYDLTEADATDDETSFSWYWYSQEFDGGDRLTMKKWEELRLQLDCNATVNPIQESFVASNILQRFRLQERALTYQFKLTSAFIDTAATLNAFSLRASLIGVRG
jgi:hypothetical protein